LQTTKHAKIVVMTNNENLIEITLSAEKLILKKNFALGKGYCEKEHFNNRMLKEISNIEPELLVEDTNNQTCK